MIAKYSNEIDQNITSIQILIFLAQIFDFNKMMCLSYQEKCISQDFSWNCDDNLESQITKNLNKNAIYSSEMQTLMTQLLGEKVRKREEEMISIDLFSTSFHRRLIFLLNMCKLKVLVH